MTVPGGVPNLPAAALTLENLAVRLQDQTASAIRNLANARVPSIFDSSTGGAIVSDLSPFGIITRIWAEVVSAIANADPADINGPEDLPGLLWDFIEGLPVIGELIGLLEAIMGTYAGDDAVLLAVQQIFFPIRKLLQLVSGQDVGFPTVEEITVGWVNLGEAVAGAVSDVGDALAKLVHVDASGLYDAAVGFNNQATSLLKYLTPTGGNIGYFDASALTGALNSAVTYGGTALSTFFGSINSSGQLLASGLTGAFNGAVTLGGVSFNTLLGNINSSGQIIASGITGALNTGVTVAGTGIGTLLSNINATGQFLGSAITGGINTAATVSGTAIGTVATNAVSAFDQLDDAVVNALGGTGAAALAYGIALQNNITSWFNAWTGSSVSRASGPDFAAAATDSASTVGQNSIDIAALQAALASANDGSVGGVNDVVPISGSLPASFTDMATTHFGSGANSAKYNTQASSDEQTASVLVPTNTGVIVVLRANAAFDTLVYLYVNPNSGGIWILGYMLAGVDHSIASGSGLGSLANKAITITVDDDYNYQFLFNGVVATTYPDSSHNTQKGSLYRYAGFATLSALPGPVTQFGLYSPGIPPGAFALLPTAGHAGDLYIASDTGLVLRDNGTTWDRVIGGPLNRFTAAPTSAWASVNVSDQTLGADLDSLLVTAPPHASDTTHYWVRVLSPTSNYTAEFYLEVCGPPDNYFGFGIILQNSTSGKFVWLDMGVNTTLQTNNAFVRLSKWDSASVQNSTYRNQSLAFFLNGMPNWWRFRDDNTSRYVEYSHNGVDWAIFHSVGRTDFITPDRIGVAVFNQMTGTSRTLRARVRSFEIF